MGNFELLIIILTELHEAGILERLVLVGSFCQDLYRIDLGEPASIPASRTLDADILVPRDIMLSEPVDVAMLLKKHGFVEAIDYQTGLQRFNHPQLAVEFLTTAKAGPQESIHRIDALKLTAQELRFMTIPLEHHYQVTYRGLPITIPEPEAFALHKLIVAGRRSSPSKAQKDIDTAQGMLVYFRQHPERMARFWEIYDSLPKRWQKRITAALHDASIKLTRPQES